MYNKILANHVKYQMGGSIAKANMECNAGGAWRCYPN